MPKDEKPQRDRFVEKARELECDEDEDRFNETLKRLMESPANRKSRMARILQAKSNIPFGLGTPELISLGVILLIFLYAMNKAACEVLVDIREELFNIQSDLQELKPDKPDLDWPPNP